MPSQDDLKRAVAKAALADVEPETFIGIGTGSTVNQFIALLAEARLPILGAVASSIASEKLLRAHGIPIANVNDGPLSVYIDGADECNDHCQLIKGGGGALTREKILAAIAKRFVCIIDASKRVKQLGEFPLPIEVIPLARSYVARECVKLGGNPVLRDGFITDNGNQILDVYDLNILQPIAFEQSLNNITGVVCNGLFAQRSADKVLIATPNGIETIAPR